MKANRFYYGLLVSGIALAGLTQSCVSDEPFGSGEGEGTLRMRLVVNSNVTRAEASQDSLSEKCVVYISGKEGLLYKYQGIDQVPTSINMKSGSYVAEAWTGDSVTASFDKKFYRGYEKFVITKDNNTAVVMTCKIANVVVSVNNATVDSDLMKDWTITVSNSRGKLAFTEDNVMEKGYFMMPNADIKTGEDGQPLKDDKGWNLYTNLMYKIEGTTLEGEKFSREGMIQGRKGQGIVERAHEYVLNLTYNPDWEDEGGHFIDVTINDFEEPVTEEIELYSAPSLTGVGFDISGMVHGTEGNFKDQYIRVACFGGLSSLNLNVPFYDKVGLPAEDFDLFNMTESRKADYKTAGLDWDYQRDAENNFATSYIKFSKELLNRIPRNDDTAYVVTLTATDIYGKSKTAEFKIAVGNVVEDPVVMEPVDNSNLLTVLSKRATLTGVVGADAVNPGIEYRIAGSGDEWKFEPAPLSRASQTFTVTLTDLVPGKKYEYRAAADGFHSKDVLTFETEPAFIIPNASMEDWSNFNGNIVIPGANGQRTFWDTGNHGSSTLSITLTNSSADMFHSGTKSAKLRSQFVGITSTIGKFAAGNLFVGEYAETKGTNGVINFGREYDGSHPDALKLWVNYRPGNATSSTKGSHIAAGMPDEGQIYVAFTTSKVRVDTSDKNTLFSKDKAEVIGYGEYNFTKAYGNDGQLQELTIPVTWKTNASNVQPTHIIIVCSASRYGDYFEGGEGSTMYVDDFELVY